jgi:hypothetical protein
MNQNRADFLRSQGRLGEVSKQTSSEDLVYTGLGVVFSRGEDIGFEDLYGTMFLPDKSVMAGDDSDGDSVVLGTDYGIGDWLVAGKTSVPVTWDHGAGLLGSKVLGKAVFEKITDEGLQFLIHVTEEQAGRYRELVEWAYKQGILGLSSQTLATMFDMDWDTGVIKSWRIGELAFTVTPADHRTRDSLVQYARSVELELVMEADMPGQLEQIARDAVDQVVVEEETETEGTDFIEEIEAVVEEVDSDLQAAAEINAERAVFTQLTALTDAVEALTARMAQLETTGLQQEHLAAVSEAMATGLEEVREGMVTAFRGLGETLVRRVHGLAVEQIEGASQLEIDTLVGEVTSRNNGQPIQAGRDEHGVPLNMPGRRS